MSHESLRKLVQSALFAALCTAMTLVIQVPSPVSGYVNLGDCGVLLSAWVLGPWYGGAAAGIGSMLADIFSNCRQLPSSWRWRSWRACWSRSTPAKLPHGFWAAWARSASWWPATSATPLFCWAVDSARRPLSPATWSRVCSAWRRRWP